MRFTWQSMFKFIYQEKELSRTAAMKKFIGINKIPLLFFFYYPYKFYSSQAENLTYLQDEQFITIMKSHHLGMGYL